MTIPHWNRINKSAQRYFLQSIQRFPLVILVATACAVVGAMIIEGHNPLLVRLMLVLQLGIPLSLSAQLLNERREALGLPSYSGVLAHILAAILLVLYFFHLPRAVGDVEILRHLQWNACVHLLVAVLPYLRQDEPWAFWNFNLKLLLRFLNSVFFTVVLFAGLSVALLAIDTLLGVDIDDDIYGRLWMVLVFGFNTLYFLGGVPSNWKALADDRQYPKVVQILGQYILTPLVSVYLLILTVYLVKVVIGTVWPSGWIGWLVSSVAVAGILSLMLLFPVTTEGKNRWLVLYQRAFHFLLIPAVAMLLMAISKRVEQYGITEPRYLLAILAVWLGAVAVAGAIRGRFFMKAIPLSLALVIFLSAWGPQGSSSVSRRSQLNRLDGLLDQQSALDNGVMVPVPGPVDHDQRQEISAVMDYLFEHHGHEVLGSRCDSTIQVNLSKVASRDSLSYRYRHSEMTRLVMDHLNLPYVAKWQGRASTHVRRFRCHRSSVLEVRGYDYGLDFSLFDEKAAHFTLAEGSLSLEHQPESTLIHIKCDSLLFLEMDLKELIPGLEKAALEHGHESIPPTLLELEMKGDSMGAHLLLDHLALTKNGDAIEVKSLSGQVLLVFH